MGEWVGGWKEEERKEGKKGKTVKELTKGPPPLKAAAMMWLGQSTCKNLSSSDHILH